MEENIKLVKEFTHTPQIMRQGIRVYQKKFVYPRAIIKSVVYLLMIVGVVALILSGKLSESFKILGYLAFVGLISLIFRELFNPLKQRDNIVQTIAANEFNPIYRMTVKEKTIEILTVEDEADSEDLSEDDTDIESDESCDTEDTVIPIDGSLKLIEEDEFFLISAYSNMIYYIIPKADFSAEELEIMRKINK